ncbi:MAG TPA: ATP-binding protein [Candidatus Saccharimonadales bacterium]
MDNLQRFISQFRSRLFALLLVDNLIILADWWLADQVFKLTGLWLLVVIVAIPLIGISFLPWLSAKYLTHPTKLLWEAILHIAPDVTNVPAPDLKRAGLGRDLIDNLVSHVYQLANVSNTVEQMARHKQRDLSKDFVAGSIPLPLAVLGPDQTIRFANEAMHQYIGRSVDDLVGQNVYSVLDMSFTNEQTLDAWLARARESKITAAQTWERVRLVLPESNKTLLFDLAVYYNKNNPDGFETMLVMFDHTKQYSQDEQAMSFVALAVHELRTPLTLLRGYVEAFEEELSGKLNPEQEGFMQKMNAAAQQLAAFVNNILNVARVEDDQLMLQLREEPWANIVQATVDDMQLRAQVRGITIETDLAKDLPSVGVDRVSISEVIINLLDNAIKYSGQSKRILVKTYLTKDGLVETTVQDFGVGIPDNNVGNLFEKFYRDHHNRSQIGGTGLGLYLSKAIITAHGGNVWVRSKLGEGSTFGFTLMPYARLADEQKNGDNRDIVRSAHGWIKNHSMYRR